MKATDDLFAIQHQVTQMADVIACAIIKRQQPAADLMTKREAYKFAGRGWIDKRLEEGLLKAVRKGTCKNSPRMFSRTEIVALQEAERLKKRAFMTYKPHKRKSQENESNS
jgi:hypothetical protein